jgi:predicted choloylglycine hydrolase
MCRLQFYNKVRTKFSFISYMYPVIIEIHNFSSIIISPLSFLSSNFIIHNFNHLSYKNCLVTVWTNSGVKKQKARFL